MFNVSYTKVFEDEKFIFIKDNDLVGTSVTNAAESVCEELLTHSNNKRIIYQDSMGLWDEMVHDGPKFIYFNSTINDEEINKILNGILYG